MYKNHKISTVIPAYNEESQIQKVINTMPSYIDDIIIIDDKSKDKTIEKVEEYMGRNNKIILIKHSQNQGVGGAIASGYKRACDNNTDIAIVMAGDGQMNPNDIPLLLDPIIEGKADYTKGNRLFSGEAFKKIPKMRYYGNAILSLLTKIVSGYWHIADSQSGFTAINKSALHAIDWNKTYKRYGQPNDLLVRLNVNNFKVKDIAVHPIYNVGERSKLKIRIVLFTISWLLVRLFFWRLKEKYIIRDFHPLVFFYTLGFFLILCSLALFIKLIYMKFAMGFFPPMSSLAWVFCTSMGLQSLFFAMWFDMDYDRAFKLD